MGMVHKYVCYELKCEGGSYMMSKESPESVHHPLYHRIAAERVTPEQLFTLRDIMHI